MNGVRGLKAWQWGLIAVIVIGWVLSTFGGSHQGNLTIDSAMFTAKDKMERHFEKADKFLYRNLRLSKNAGEDIICGEVLPLGTPPLGIPWSRFVLFVQGNHGFFGGENGGFEFRRRHEIDPITSEHFNSVWQLNCASVPVPSGGATPQAW